MANTYQNNVEVTADALAILENSLCFTNTVRHEWDDRFGIDGAQIGNTLQIRVPPRFLGGTGDGITIEDITEGIVPLVLTTNDNVAMNFTTTELKLNVNRFKENIIAPAVATLANKVDLQGCSLANLVYNYVGTPAVTPADLDIYLNAQQKLDENATPRLNRMRHCVFNPAANNKLVFALKGLFNPGGQISAQYGSGLIEAGPVGTIGLDWHMDQNVFVHTNGVFGGTPLVNGAGQTGASLNTKGWTASTGAVKAGDRFTIGTGTASIYATNPQNHQSTGALQQFVVLQDATADGSGNMTISISPAITAAGAFQNVTATPADAAAITLAGTASQVTPQNLVFHKGAFAFACAPQPKVGGVDIMARVDDDELGLSIRMIRAYDVNTNRLITRLDFLYGFAPLYPQWACVVFG